MTELNLNAGWQLENSYATLPRIFFEPASPLTAPKPQLVMFNQPLADALGLKLSDLDQAHLAALFTGQMLPSGATPIAQAYAGHQFGGFTMLGDGRAILIGEQITPTGQRFDIQLKGSGITPYSRRGDGKAALGPMLREYIISEAMDALKIPTTRSLAVTTTGQSIFRDGVKQGAMLTRVAASHIRVGTFQFFMGRRDPENLKVLADYTIARHYPHLIDHPTKYLQFLIEVIDRQAALIASWQHIGFVHGVMNTDNMAISGETIDYGPCAFMDHYDPATVFSSIDEDGRYAYGNQPSIAQWNLARFAETLLGLIDSDIPTAVERATHELNQYPAIFERYWLHGMRQKVGLILEFEEDEKQIHDLLDILQQYQLDYTNFFDDLSTGKIEHRPIYMHEAIQQCYQSWKVRIQKENEPESVILERMQQINPSIIPRNARVEEALLAAEAGDLNPLHKLLEVLSKPYHRGEDLQPYREPPTKNQRRYRTFCGT